MKFVLELWPENGDEQLTPAQAVQRAIDSVRDHGEELAWEVDTGDATEHLTLVMPHDLLDLKRLLTWESGGTDEPGDQNASSALVEHGHWSLGPADEDGEWGVELIEKYSNLEENPKGGIHLGHFATEQDAKDAAEAYERDHREDRLTWYVPILLHIDAKTASGAVDTVHGAIGDGQEVTITAGRNTLTVYANAPMDTEQWGGTELAYALDKEGRTR